MALINELTGGHVMGLIGWLILGALAGWLASLINKTNQEQGWIGNIILGVIGALVGGFAWNLLFGKDGDSIIDFSIGSLILAVVGALIVSYIYTMITGKRGV
jgi:uncharacterized membrane protein YeaQ/YmgE (transglycosylase-associated protein family)